MVIISKQNCISEDIFVLANSLNPDEKLYYASLHLGLYCLPKYAFRSHQYRKG